MIFILIKNELIKLMNRKKTWVVTIAFILLIGTVAFGSYKNNENLRKWNSPEYRIKSEKNNIQYLKEMRNDKKISDRDKEGIKEQIKDSEERIKKIRLEVKTGKKDWMSELKKSIKNDEETLKIKDIDKNQREYLITNVEKNKYLLQNNIEPQDKKYEVRATSFIIELFTMLGMMFLAVGVIIFGADMVSGEYTPPTMKFLLTQPISRGKILFSKFIALILSSTIIIILIEFIAFIIMGFLFKFGDLNYPVQVGTKYVYDLIASPVGGHRVLNVIKGSTYIIPIWKYIIELFLLQGLFIITVASFTFLLSTILKSSMVSISVSIVVVIIFNIIGVMPFTSKVSQYLFSTYGNPISILNGNMGKMLNNPSITLNFSIGVLVIWSVVSYLIAHFVFKKKDILI